MIKISVCDDDEGQLTFFKQCFMGYNEKHEEKKFARELKHQMKHEEHEKVKQGRKVAHEEKKEERHARHEEKKFEKELKHQMKHEE